MNPITALRVWIRLRSLFEKERQLMTMKLTTSTFCQIVLGIGDVVNVVTPLLSGENKIIAGAVLSILHIVVNTIAHISNPDGTPAVTKGA